MIKYYDECIDENLFIEVVLKHSDIMIDKGFDDYNLLYGDVKKYILGNYEDYLELYFKYKDY